MVQEQLGHLLCMYAQDCLPHLYVPAIQGLSKDIQQLCSAVDRRLEALRSSATPVPPGSGGASPQPHDAVLLHSGVTVSSEDEGGSGEDRGRTSRDLSSTPEPTPVTKQRSEGKDEQEPTVGGTQSCDVSHGSLPSSPDRPHVL